MHGASIALVLTLALCGCAVERDPGKQYTVMGQEIGERAFHDIDAYDGKVSFVGADPVRRREVQTVRDRYREKLTLKNNGLVEYSKLFLGGFSPRFTDEDMIEKLVAQPGYKALGIVFDRAKIRRTGELVYLVQSSPTHTCFVAYFVFGTATGEARQTARGDQDVGASLCYPAGATSAAVIEREMVDILSRARYDDGAGNRARHAPPGIHAGPAPAAPPNQA